MAGNLGLGNPLNVFEERVAALKENGFQGLISTIGIRFRSAAPTLAITVAAYQASQVSDLVNLSSHFKSGDTMVIVNGNGGHALDIPTLNAWQQELAAAMPDGVLYGAQTSGVANAGAIAQGASPAIGSVYYDYEPNYEPEFTWDFPTTRTNFSNFAAAVRPYNRLAMGLPSGRALFESDLQKYGWNYGVLGSLVDGQVPMIEHWLAVSEAEFETAIGTVLTQYAQHGVSTARLGFEVSMQGTNAVSPQDAATAIQYMVTRGVPRPFIWWDPTNPGDLQTLLTSLGR